MVWANVLAVLLTQISRKDSPTPADPENHYAYTMVNHLSAHYSTLLWKKNMIFQASAQKIYLQQQASGPAVYICAHSAPLHHCVTR